MSSPSNNELQEVRVKLNKRTSIVGIYIGPQTPGNRAEQALNKLHKNSNNERVIIAGDLNARHTNCYRILKNKRTTVAKWTHRRGLCITALIEPSYKAKERAGDSNHDLLIDEEPITVLQPSDEVWKDSLDHSPLLYKTARTTLKTKAGRISKMMLSNADSIA